MQGLDIIVLLRLLDQASATWTIRSLAGELHVPAASVQRSLKRLERLPVWDAGGRRVNRSETERLLLDASRFMFPAALGGETRGVATGWAAPPLVNELVADRLPPVWPSPTGGTRGLAVEPLHPIAVRLAADDPKMYEWLALVDALRLGNGRVRGLAAEALLTRLESAGRA